jgi:uncharacterized Rmd1/YagE family protein
MELFRLVLRNNHRIFSPKSNLIFSNSSSFLRNYVKTENQIRLNRTATLNKENSNQQKDFNQLLDQNLLTDSASVQTLKSTKNGAVDFKKKTITNVAASLLSKQKQIKKKPKKPPTPVLDSLPSFKIKAYATADYYDLDLLRKYLIKSGAYEFLDQVAKNDMPDDCLCVKAKYMLHIDEIEPRHIFIFENGSVVFWNVSSEEQTSVLQILDKVSDNAYPSEMVTEESETMQYYRFLSSDDPSFTRLKTEQDLGEDEEDLKKLIQKNKIYFDHRQTCMIKNQIFFSDYSTNDRIKNKEKKVLLEQYSFSDAIASSVKLGIWEKNLFEFTERIEFIASDLKSGTVIKLKSDDVLRFLGELFTMRHVVNLHSNLLSTPDFYWDREDLELLYSELSSYLSIAKRTRLFNERLNHCIDLMEILKQHLTDNKHTRLEWIIIGLITIEVLIGLGIFDFLKHGSLVVFDSIKNNLK